MISKKKYEKAKAVNRNTQLKVIQHYSICLNNCSGYNEEIQKDIYKIEISLSDLMSRRNMCFNQLLNRINYFFLVEYLCVILQEQGLWHVNLCNNGSVCNIQKTVSKMYSFI